MKKINSIAGMKAILFTVAIIWQTSVSANTITERADNQVDQVSMTDLNDTVNHTQVKLIQIKVIELTDNSGLKYIGGKVNAADLDHYLSQMKKILGDDFALYRQHQSARDHHAFHMTLINPYEYQTITQDIALGSSLSVSLNGLGRVKQGNKTTYFVVGQSLEVASYRQKLALTKKDFHVTLGFYPSDIYGVDKSASALIE
ncbi:hypothetical protein [Colwellia piezophila]|uniref:hypothetical protein n=1 Tax=Colwellia piezophila TaxID=211668 RepID=UPI000371F8FA|nr:hypothetical protein [Colwellia piezophila]